MKAIFLAIAVLDLFIMMFCYEQVIYAWNHVRERGSFPRYMFGLIMGMLSTISLIFALSKVIH